MKLLVTTGLENTWGKSEELVFLGEWCKIHQQRHVWKKRNFSVLKNHWDDRIKLKNDHSYLVNLHQKLLLELSIKLNETFNLNLSNRAWQIILDPWLLTHISVIWDRWETINNFSFEDSCSTISLKCNDSISQIFDYNNYISNIFTHEWNHIEFIRIIKHSFSEKIRIVYSKESIKIKKPTFKTSFTNTQLLFNLFDLFSTLIYKNNKTLFFSSYFDVINIFKLNISLRQIPKFYHNTFKWPIKEFNIKNGDPDVELRNSLKINILPNNKFEKYLFDNILHDLPYVYLEGFPLIFKKAKKINLKPNLIFTANAHWHNELFKTWAALMIMNDSKLITMEHGGGIHQTMNCMNFEEDIADYRTMWVNPYHQKHVKLPPNKSLYRVKSSKKYLSIIGYENPLYNYRVEASPKGSQIKFHNEIIIGLHSKLDAEIKKYFKIHPYKNMGFNTRNIFATELGENKVSNKNNLLSFFKEAKILICTYPQTTFSEAMYSDIPVILIYPKEFWETISEMDVLIEKLKSCNILFDDYNLAAAHINANWRDPYLWWDSVKVISVRKYFKNYIMSDDKNWLLKWTLFINSLNQ